MQDASEVVVGANGRILVADADTVAGLLPDDMGALDGTFMEVGYVSEDGVTFTNGQDIEDILAWQSFYPVRKVVTGKSTSVQFAMRQWNEITVKLAFGGGEIDVNSGVSIYVPPAPDTLDERAMVVEWEDGDDTYRLVLPRGLVTGEVESNVVRSAAADLPVSFDVTPSGQPDDEDLSTQPWYLITDAPWFLS